MCPCFIERSSDFLGQPLSTFLPVEWGGRAFAYCAENGFSPLTLCFFVSSLLLLKQSPRLFSSGFIFSNMTENEGEEVVTRLALTCVQDWDDTGPKVDS